MPCLCLVLATIFMWKNMARGGGKRQEKQTNKPLLPTVNNKHINEKDITKIKEITMF